MPADDLDATAASAMARHAMPGLVLGLVRGSSSEIRCYGDADVATGRPVTADTVFRIASVSKTMTALAIMQLRDAGKLDLDDPIDRHLRQFRVVAPGPDVTIRHLLTHMSGLGEVRSLRDLLQLRTMAAVGMPPGAAAPAPGEYYGKGLRPAAPAGVKWAYSNHAFNVLGAIVEDVSGQRFDDYVGKCIIEPIGLTDTTFRRADIDAQRFAVGYKRTRRGVVPATDLDVALPAAGAGFSTAADLCHYAEHLLSTLRGEEGVISAATLREMCEPQLGRPAGIGEQGLPFFLSTFDGHRVAWHGGAWNGFATLFLLAPDDDVAVVAWSNRWQPSGAAGNAEVVTAALRSMLGSRPTASTPIADDPSEWPLVTGRYTTPPGLAANLNSLVATGNQVEVRAVNGALTIRTLLGPLAKAASMRRVDRFTYEFDPTDSASDAFYHQLDSKQPVRLVFEPGTDGRMRLRGLEHWEFVRRDRALGLVSLRRLLP